MQRILKPEKSATAFLAIHLGNLIGHFLTGNLANTVVVALALTVGFGVCYFNGEKLT